METFKELDELVAGLSNIEKLCDNVTIALQGDRAVVTKIPVTFMGGNCHSCKDPENCKLNTSINPYWCMTYHDQSELDNEREA